MSTFIINSFSFVPIGIPDLAFASSPNAANTYSVGFDVRASLNQDGILYFVALPQGSATPNANSIISKNVANSLFYFSDTTEKDFLLNFPVRNLTPLTTYDLYAVGQNTITLQTTSVAKLTANTIAVPPVYQSVGSGYIIGNQNTVWQGTIAPPPGAVANISHVVLVDYPPMGSLVQQQNPSQANAAFDRTLNIKEFGNLEVGDVSRNAGSGGYYAFWDVFRNSTINLEANSCFSVQYMGDGDSAHSKGKFNILGDDVTFCSLSDIQLQCFGSLTVTVPSKIYIEGFYTTAGSKDCKFLFEKVNINHDTSFLTRPGMNRSAFLAHYHNYLPAWTGVVYTSYTSSNTSPIASISSTNNTVVFANNFTTGPTGQLIEGRYINITGTANNNVLRCIRKVVSANTVELFGNTLNTQGASGTGQICPVGNPNVPAQLYFDELNVANGKVLTFQQNPVFNGTNYSDLYVYLYGNIKNEGTIIFDTKGIGTLTLAGERNIVDANSKYGNIIVKGSARFYYLNVLQNNGQTISSNSKILSYEVDPITRDLIVTCNTVLQIANLGKPNSVGTDGGALATNTAIINNDVITLTQTPWENFPVLKGMIVDINGGSGPTFVIKDVNKQRNRITLTSNTGLSNTTRTLKLKYYNFPCLIQNTPEEPLLANSIGIIKRILPNENKFVITFEKNYDIISPAKTFSAPQGNVIMQTSNYHTIDFFGRQYSGVAKPGFMTTANVILQNTVSLIGAPLQQSINHTIGGNFIFEGTEHSVWFGGYGSYVEVDSVEFRNNSSIMLDGNVSQINTILSIKELKMTSNGTIRSKNNTTNGLYIYINKVSGNGTLTFTPRSDAATSTSLNRFYTVSTSNSVIDFTPPFIIDRKASAGQLCFEITSGKTVRFTSLQIEGNVIPPGTYTTSNTLLNGAFTGAGNLIVLS